MAYTKIAASAALAVLLAFSVASPTQAVTLNKGVAPIVVQTVAAKAGDTVMVSGKTANLRSGPTAKSKKIAALSKGTKLQVVEVTKSGWLKVKGPQGDGYVSGKLVK